MAKESKQHRDGGGGRKKNRLFWTEQKNLCPDFNTNISRNTKKENRFECDPSAGLWIYLGICMSVGTNGSACVRELRIWFSFLLLGIVQKPPRWGTFCNSVVGFDRKWSICCNLELHSAREGTSAKPIAPSELLRDSSFGERKHPAVRYVIFAWIFRFTKAIRELCRALQWTCTWGDVFVLLWLHSHAL